MSPGHRIYRDFFIRNTYKNHRIVDKFYKTLGEPEPQATGAVRKLRGGSIFDKCTEEQLNDALNELIKNSDTESYLYKQYRAFVVNSVKKELDSDGSTLEARITRAGESFRSVVKHDRFLAWDKLNFEKFLRVFTYKCLELMQDGLVEGYLAFKVFNPKMVSIEIQPYFNFKGKAYSDDRWVSIVTDDFWKPYVKDVYFMSGFNRFWRTDRGVYLGEYSWSHFLETLATEWLDSDYLNGSGELSESFCHHAKKYDWKFVQYPENSIEDFRSEVRGYLMDAWLYTGAPFKQKDRVWLEKDVDYIMKYVHKLCSGMIPLDVSELEIGRFYGINYKIDGCFVDNRISHVMRITEIDSSHLSGYVIGSTGVTRVNLDNIETIYEAR